MRLADRRRARRGNASVRALLESGLEDSAPEISLINLVDLMLVFAVGLMLALASQRALSDASTNAKPLSQQRMKLTGESQRGAGERVGAAYRLENGEIVYVPESAEHDATHH